MNAEPHHRSDDGELVGYLEEVDGGPTRPLGLLGHPLGAPMARIDAERLLEEEGLASVARPWWVRAPRPLPSGTVLDRPVAGWEWRRMVVAEVTEHEARLHPQYPGEDEQGSTGKVTLPAVDLVLQEQPGPS